MGLLERYRAGQHEAVWRELARLEPGNRPAEALAVAWETMQRVRANVETLRDRLTGLGYRFGVYPDGEALPYDRAPITPLSPEQLGHIDALAALAGPLPLSLELFWRVVGEVNFIGRYDAWPVYADPLVVYAPEVALEEYATWQVNDAYYCPDVLDPLLAVIAPDDLHKDNVSGGPPYGIALPCDGCDGRLVNLVGEPYFVEYLREAILGWGGFPGFARSKRGAPPEIAMLTESLIPF